MKRRIINGDVKVLASIAQGLQADYVSNDQAWNGSPFAWIRTRPSRQRGKIGEQLVAGWCAARNLNVVRSPDSDADRIQTKPSAKMDDAWTEGKVGGRAPHFKGELAFLRRTPVVERSSLRGKDKNR